MRSFRINKHKDSITREIMHLKVLFMRLMTSVQFMFDNIKALKLESLMYHVGFSL